MDAGSRERVSVAERAGIIMTGLSADMVVNYPLWISAKRIAAGLTLPPVGEIYKGSGSLLLAMGPMIIVQDATTAVMLRFFDGKLDPTIAHASSACISGGVGALAIGAQIEAVITRAHASNETIVQSARNTFRAGGAFAIVAPYGAMMIAAREVPYAGCLFFLSGWIRAKLDIVWAVRASEPGSQDGGGSGTAGSGILRDMAAAVLTASVAGPISQAPNVIAAHQQAHAVSFPEACRRIIARAGYGGFYGGLLTRTASLAGSLFVFPFTIECVQPYCERWRRVRAADAKN